MSMQLSTALRQRTVDLHNQAERSGIIHDMLRGRATRHGYSLLLRNLLPAYQEMERALEHHRLSPGLHELARPEVYRASALEADLNALHGEGWRDTLPMLPASAEYARRVVRVSQEDGSRLIAHAYARYMGDLNGGRILKRLISRSLGLEAKALNFYEFPDIDDLDAFKTNYRDGLDRTAHAISDIDAVVEEAAEAFRLNIALSQAVQEISRS